jgi:hypothetical protein
LGKTDNDPHDPGDMDWMRCTISSSRVALRSEALESSAWRSLRSKELGGFESDECRDDIFYHERSEAADRVTDQSWLGARLDKFKLAESELYLQLQCESPRSVSTSRIPRITLILHLLVDDFLVLDHENYQAEPSE